MDAEHVSRTIEMVQSQILNLEKQLSEKKRMVNGLCALVDRPAVYADTDPSAEMAVGIRSDEFYGRPLASVVKAILQKREAARLGAASLDELYDAMIRGGFKFEAKNDGTAKRSLAISISKNAAFHRVPNGNIGLTAWYPEAKRGNGTKAENNGQAREVDDDSYHNDFAEQSDAGDPAKVK